MSNDDILKLVTCHGKHNQRTTSHCSQDIVNNVPAMPNSDYLKSILGQ